MIRAVAILAGIALAALPAVGQEARRSLEAHAHGEGSLAIAIEGGRIEMELEVPASDIVGFEHAPRTAAQRKALAEARQRLAKPDTLFVLSPAAGCKVTSAKVEVVGAAAAGKEHSHAGHAHAHSDKGKPSRRTEKAVEPTAHSELIAAYAIECSKIGSLTSIAFEFFEAFKGAERLAVTVISPKGQSSFKISRDKPRLDLAGLS